MNEDRICLFYKFSLPKCPTGISVNVSSFPQNCPLACVHFPVRWLFQQPFCRLQNNTLRAIAFRFTARPCLTICSTACIFWLKRWWPNFTCSNLSMSSTIDCGGEGHHENHHVLGRSSWISSSWPFRLIPSCPTIYYQRLLKYFLTSFLAPVSIYSV